jgi:hypothetical protein
MGAPVQGTDVSAKQSAADAAAVGLLRRQLGRSGRRRVERRRPPSCSPRPTPAPRPAPRSSPASSASRPTSTRCRRCSARRPCSPAASSPAAPPGTETVNLAASDFFRTIEINNAAGSDTKLKCLQGLFTGPPPSGLARSYAWVHVIRSGDGAVAIEGPNAPAAAPSPPCSGPSSWRAASSTGTPAPPDRQPPSPAAWRPWRCPTAPRAASSSSPTPSIGTRAPRQPGPHHHGRQRQRRRPDAAADGRQRHQHRRVARSSPACSPARSPTAPRSRTSALTYNFGTFLARGHIEAYVFQDVSASSTTPRRPSPARRPPSPRRSPAPTPTASTSSGSASSASRRTPPPVAIAMSPATPDPDDTLWQGVSAAATNNDLVFATQQDAGWRRPPTPTRRPRPGRIPPPWRGWCCARAPSPR